MNKRIRTALTALLIAFAFAFSTSQFVDFTWTSSDTAGGVGVTASIKPPKGVVLGLVANEQWPDWSKRKP
jgi:hypothetical protein